MGLYEAAILTGIIIPFWIGVKRAGKEVEKHLNRKYNLWVESRTLDLDREKLEKIHEALEDTLLQRNLDCFSEEIMDQEEEFEDYQRIFYRKYVANHPLADQNRVSATFRRDYESRLREFRDLFEETFPLYLDDPPFVSGIED